MNKKINRLPILNRIDNNRMFHRGSFWKIIGKGDARLPTRRTNWEYKV